MSASAAASAATPAPAPQKRSVGAEPFAASPHFFFRLRSLDLARPLTYTEHAVLGIILDSTISWRRGKWKSKWRFQLPEKLSELTSTSPANVYAALAALEGANLIESRKIPLLGAQYRIKLRSFISDKPDERQGLLWEELPVTTDNIEAKCPDCKDPHAVLEYEDGFCPAPHSYFRDLPSRVTYAVWLVVGLILDRTVAANRAEGDDWEKIFLWQFERFTALSHRAVQMALNEARELGLIGVKESSGGAGLASSYRVYTKRFGSCPKRPAKVIPIDSRHRNAPAKTEGEQKVETVGEKVAEIPHKKAQNRAMELKPIAVRPMLRHPACGWIGILSDDVGVLSSLLQPQTGQEARASARAGPPPEARPAKKSKFDEAMDRWREKYGDE